MEHGSRGRCVSLMLPRIKEMRRAQGSCALSFGLLPNKAHPWLRQAGAGLIACWAVCHGRSLDPVESSTGLHLFAVFATRRTRHDFLHFPVAGPLERGRRGGRRERVCGPTAWSFLSFEQRRRK